MPGVPPDRAGGTPEGAAVAPPVAAASVRARMASPLRTATDSARDGRQRRAPRLIPLSSRTSAMSQPAPLSLPLASMLLAAVPAAAIVGGNPTSPDLYPYYARLQIHKFEDPAKSSECGASVIDPHWILTAAHCITDGLERNGITIDVFINFCDPCQEVAFNATDLIMHPLWDEDYTHGHDLALLRVATGVTVATDTVRNVQVGAPADPGAYANGVIATVVGHGATHEGGPLTTELNDLNTPLHSDDYMDDIYNPWYWFDNWNSALMIGAGWTNHTVCNGDSGGPLTVDR